MIKVGGKTHRICCVMILRLMDAGVIGTCAHSFIDESLIEDSGWKISALAYPSKKIQIQFCFVFFSLSLSLVFFYFWVFFLFQYQKIGLNKKNSIFLFVVCLMEKNRETMEDGKKNVYNIYMKCQNHYTHMMEPELVEIMKSVLPAELALYLRFFFFFYNTPSL